MRELTELKIQKWPFLLGDALFVGAVYFIYLQSKLPMGAWQIFFVILCVAGGAWLGIMPFLLEYRLTLKQAEAQTLASAVGQIQNVERVADEISAATSQWQSIQEQAQKTAAGSEALVARMASEAKAFCEFLERANDTEKANLRLEVEKLRRSENEWVQVLVRVLDHVYALHQGALRSGQPRLLEQVGNFQSACRDTARRVGLTPFIATAAEPFDAQRHQLAEPDTKASPGSLISETIATGFTFRGKLLRPALVRLQNLPRTEAEPNGKPGTTQVVEPAPAGATNAV